MKKLRYQGAITKIIAEKIAAYHKRNFLKNSENIIRSFSVNSEAGVDVISFSGTHSFEDQMISICSFMYYAGIPLHWTIYSDKSYTTAHKELFKKFFPFVSVVDWDVFDYVNSHSCLAEYLEFCHLAKKVNVILGHAYSRQTLYVDSDVIFYKHFSYYLTGSTINKGLWYISDTLGNAGKKGVSSPETAYPLNSGFLVLNDAFKKEDILEYFENLKGNFHYFSEQSSIEYAFRKQAAILLDPKEFIVDTGDQFDFFYKYHPEEIALRHYVTPVRHKIWQRGWKWHFVK